MSMSSQAVDWQQSLPFYLHRVAIQGFHVFGMVLRDIGYGCVAVAKERSSKGSRIMAEEFRLDRKYPAYLTGVCTKHPGRKDI